MIKVTFIEQDGNRRAIMAQEGDPLMHAARDAGVSGIIAECGGSAMCATCHCYVVEIPEGALHDPRPDEIDTIEFLANEPRPESRLICQITTSRAMEGAVFAVATGR